MEETKDIKVRKIQVDTLSSPRRTGMYIVLIFNSFFVVNGLKKQGLKLEII